ncbi:MAG: helix-turn-helix domain-containing protein [Parvularculaceae bacterium]
MNQRFSCAVQDLTDPPSTPGRRINQAAADRHLQKIAVTASTSDPADERYTVNDTVRYDRRVQSVIEYIEEYIGEDLSLTSLARIAGLSAHYFGGVFREATGISLHRYIMKRRVERACMLLRETEDSITSIAFALGFSSHAHFATTFRRYLNISPSQFRASLR